MNEILENLVICDALRTPFCHGTKMRDYTPADLLEILLKNLVKRNNLNPLDISAVVAGCVQQDTRFSNIARIAALKAGFSEKSADYSIQTNCNSGFMGLLTAIGGIATGLGELYISAGVESMSNYGFRLEDKTRQHGSTAEIVELIQKNQGDFLTHYDIVDCLWEGLGDEETNITMIEIAEIMANCFHISRNQQDEYTLRNLKKAVDAVQNGIMNDYICRLPETENDTYPLNRKRMINKPEKFTRTDTVFGENSLLLNPGQFFEKHKDHFGKYGVTEIEPTVTMYNSCIPGDGAGACIVTTRTKAESLGLQPIVRIIGWATAGVDPVIMGIGPVEAVHMLFQKPTTKRAHNIPFEKVDIIEIHEAFASQVLSVFKESKRKYGYTWDAEKVNAYGGSLAYTHPLGATNFRLLTNICTRFKENKDAIYALATGCAGGGQGTALLFERYS